MLEKTVDQNLSEWSCYRFPIYETRDQLENVFVFIFETYNYQIFAEAFAAGFYKLYRLRDRWDRPLTPE